MTPHLSARRKMNDGREFEEGFNKAHAHIYTHNHADVIEKEEKEENIRDL